MEQSGARIVLAKGAFGYVKNRCLNSRVRRPNCVTAEKIKRLFSWDGSVPIFEGCFPL